MSRALREEVLRAPIGLSLQEEDVLDEKAHIHFGAFEPDGTLVACAIAVPLSPVEAKVRQMAVSPDRQGRGIGQRLMQKLEKHLQTRGITRIVLHARVSALDFYKKVGYTVVSEEFVEVTIPHVRMVKTLRQGAEEDRGVSESLPISTERLVLRPFRDSDLEEFLAYRNDPSVARFQSWEGLSRDEAAAFLRQNIGRSLGTPGQWQQIAIALASDDRLIGDLGLFLREDGSSAELGFTLAARNQGRGFAREAMVGLIDALFGRPDILRLEAITDSRNAPAMALLARLGFEIQSTADAVFKGTGCREHTYALPRAAWRAA